MGHTWTYAANGWWSCQVCHAAVPSDMLESYRAHNEGHCHCLLCTGCGAGPDTFGRDEALEALAVMHEMLRDDEQGGGGYTSNEVPPRSDGKVRTLNVIGEGGQVRIYESLEEIVDEITDTGVPRDPEQGGRDRTQGGALRLKTGGSFWRNVLKGLFGK